MKKVPLRKCIGCQVSKPKKELLRIVKDKNGKINVDISGKLQGRGAYICYDINCLEKAKKQKRLEREFEITNIDENFIEEIKGVIEKSDK